MPLLALVDSFFTSTEALVATATPSTLSAPEPVAVSTLPAS